MTAAPAVLITGASGFVGGALARHLAAEGLRVAGVARSGPPPGWPEGGTFRNGDVRDPALLPEFARAVRPRAIAHLASPSFLPEVAARPAEAAAVILAGLLHAIRAAALVDPPARVLYASTAEVYGGLDAGAAFTEDMEPAPAHPYGVLKLAGEIVGRDAAGSAGVAFVAARLFNHVGPGQDTRFAAASFAAQVAAIARGAAPPVVRAANLEARRDLIDVRDGVRALALLLDPAAPEGVFNVCTGTSRPVREILDGLLGLAGVAAEVVTEDGRRRPGDRPESRGDPSRLAAATGFRPRIPFTTTLRDILADAVARAAL